MAKDAKPQQLGPPLRLRRMRATDVVIVDDEPILIEIETIKGRMVDLVVRSRNGRTLEIVPASDLAVSGIYLTSRAAAS